MGGFVAKIISPPKPPPAPVQQVVTEAPKGPTTAEIDDLTTRKKLSTDRRGRRATMLTSTKGVDEDITLGSKTLLG